MSLFILLLVNLFLAVGMLKLPSLAGEGAGSLFARVWLAFGLMVLIAHFHSYRENCRKSAAMKNLAMVHHQQKHSMVRNLENR